MGNLRLTKNKLNSGRGDRGKFRKVETTPAAWNVVFGFPDPPEVEKYWHFLFDQAGYAWCWTLVATLASSFKTNKL